MNWVQDLRESGSEGAPPRVEARLREALRNQAADGHGWRWMPAAIAALAMIVVAVGVGDWKVLVLEEVSPPAVLSARSLPPKIALQKAGDGGPRLHPVRTGHSATRNPKPTVAGEVATDFFPLQYVSDPRFLGNEALVRVKLPRAVLGGFGFPVEVERRQEEIQAEVLLGEDGTAHAIRFVQPVPKFTRASY